MSKVEIITRCYNRLEYTSMCIRSIKHLTDYKDYSHIIVDQGSTDGTPQFLNSLEKEKFYNLKVKYNKSNSGDAGGMLDGYKMIDNDCKYVFQFDNDCEVITENYIEKLVNVMDSNPKIGIIMLKRKGVINVLNPTNIRKINDITVGDIHQATCCMIIRRDLLDKINVWFNGQKIHWGFTISQKIKNLGYSVLKSTDVQVNHIDGGNVKHKQSKKYPSYVNSVTSKYSNYRKINYNK